MSTTRSIAVSIVLSDSTEVRRWRILGGTHEHMQRFIKEIQAAHPEATLKFCYEAASGPAGLETGVTGFFADGGKRRGELRMIGWLDRWMNERSRGGGLRW
jgi:hypothetical protein